MSTDAQARADELPVDSLRDAVAYLRRPFAAEAVKFKIQTNPKGDNGRAMIVTFIDARLVSERLNLVCPHLWETAFDPVAGGMMCHLTIDGRTRRDVGHAENTGTDIGLKSLYSDAFKRAAVHFGVGASLYTLPRVFVPAAKLKKVRDKWFLPEGTEQSLRGGYRTWLESKGSELFGQPLGHGDVAGATGDEIDPPVEPSDDPANPDAEAVPAPGVSEVVAEELFAAAKAAGTTSTKRLDIWLTSLGVPHDAITDQASAVAALRNMSPEQASDALEFFAADEVAHQDGLDSTVADGGKGDQ